MNHAHQLRDCVLLKNKHWHLKNSRALETVKNESMKLRSNFIYRMV